MLQVPINVVIEVENDRSLLLHVVILLDLGRLLRDNPHEGHLMLAAASDPRSACPFH